MRSLIFFLFLLSSFMMAAQGNSSRDSTPKFSNEFLNIGVGARAFGLGQSMVSHVDDVTAGYWNPAGLSAVPSDFQLGLMHADFFAGIANYDYGAFAAKINEKSALSVSVVRFSVDFIPDTRFLFDANGAIDYERVRFFSAIDNGFYLSYGQELPVLGGLRVGGNTKVIHRIAGSFAKSWGFGLDLGAQKTWNGWNFGLMGRDIFGTFNTWAHNPDEVRDIFNLTNNEIPTNSIEITLPRVMLGVSKKFELLNAFSLLATFDFDFTFDGKRNTVVSSEAISIDPHGGLEFGFKDLAFLRFGINNIQEQTDFDRSAYWTFQPNAGLGIAIKEIYIDYALTDIGDQSDALFSHIFSLKVNFNVQK